MDYSMILCIESVIAIQKDSTLLHNFATERNITDNKNGDKIMFGIGTQEILFIALIVLLFFGGKKIPELMKGLGKGVKSFKDGMNGIADSENEKDNG